MEAAGGVGADLGRAFLGVEQPRELQRDDAPRVRARPHVELPVVGGAHDRARELRIAHTELVALAREPGERRREAQRRVHAVEVHVVHARVDVVRAAPHLVEPGGIERALVQRLAHHRVEPDLVVLLPVVEPVLARAVVLGHHAWRGVGELRRHAALEHVRWLHQVVVDRDEGDVARLARRVGQPVDLGRLLAGGEEPLTALDLVEADRTATHRPAPASSGSTTMTPRVIRPWCRSSSACGASSRVYRRSRITARSSRPARNRSTSSGR